MNVKGLACWILVVVVFGAIRWGGSLTLILYLYIKGASLETYTKPI